jgi:NAD(P)-dependent dehydrogenase (short-subunit alcohol dehydrogenase family)
LLAVRLANKVALITGGGTGIGAAVAERFAAEGANVVLLGRRQEPLDAIAGEIGGRAVAGDASSMDDMRKAVSVAVEEFGGLDILIASAGTLAFGDVLEVDDETWDRELRNNLKSCIVSTRAALPALIERGGGSIVIVSTAGAVLGTPAFVTYTTAKTALVGLMRSLAVDHGRQGVRVNVVLPGLIRTAMSDSLIEAIADSRGISVAEAYERFGAVNPLGRTADPAEIAGVCFFLASSDASFVTGSVITADGGHTIVNAGTLAFAD